MLLNKTVTLADLDEMVADAKQGILVSDLPVSQEVLDALTDIAFSLHPNQALVDNVYKAFENGSAGRNEVLFKEWSEELHPRDDRGRFGDGDDAGTPWKRIPNGTFVKALKGKFEAVARNLYGPDFEMAPSYTRFGDRVDSLLGATDTYTNGATTVSFDRPENVDERAGDVKLTDGDKQALLTKVAQLQEDYPVYGMTVHFNSVASEGQKGIGGSLGGNPVTPMIMLVDLTTQGDMAAAPHGWMMPAVQATTALDYSLTHEWGHAVDFNDGGTLGPDLYRELLSSGAKGSEGLSAYARTSFDTGETKGRELFAEAFAQHYFEEKGVTPPTGTQAVSSVARLARQN